MKTKKLKSKDSIFTSELTQRLLPEMMVIKPKHIEQSGFLRRTILIKNFPATIETDFILTNVTQIKNTTFTMHLVPMTSTKTAMLVDKQINNAKAQSHEKKGTRQIAADIDAESIRKSYDAFLKEKGRFYIVNIYIEVYALDEEELRERVNEVTAALTASHISAQQLIYEQKEGFIGVSPIGKDLLTVGANNIPSNTLAAMYPFSYSSRNDAHGMPLGKTKDGGYMFLDPWIRNQNLTSGNIIIVGETGYGKSYLIKKILAMMIACGVSCFMIDPEGEYDDVFRNLGGSVVHCASGSFLINPFEIRRLKTESDSPNDLDNEIQALNQEQSFFQHLSWLKDFYKVLFPYLNGMQLAALTVLTQDMYIRFGIDHKTDLSKLTSSDYPTFTNLYEYIHDVLEDRNKYGFYKEITDDMLRDLLLAIRDAYDGSLSPLFNGHTNLCNDKLINFNIQELLTGSEERTQAVLFNVMTYLWHRITKKENRVMFGVDELYLLMNRDNLTIAKYLRSFIKRARKYESIIVTATQQLADLDDEKIRFISSAIINSASIKFLFNPGNLAYERTKKILQLTDGEADSIYRAKRGQCLLKVGQGDKYNVNIGTLPYEDELFGSGGGR